MLASRRSSGSSPPCARCERPDVEGDERGQDRARQHADGADPLDLAGASGRAGSTACRRPPRAGRRPRGSRRGSTLALMGYFTSSFATSYVGASGASFAGPMPIGMPASGWFRSNAGDSRTDARDRREVVARRRAAGRPLERAAVAPRVVHRDLRRVARREVHVHEERDHRDREDAGADRRDLVHPGEAVVGQVRRVATRHADDAEPVLDEERRVEADEQQPEVPLAEPLVEHLAGPLGPPEVEAGEHREHDGAEHDVVEVRDDEVRVGHVEVERRRRQDDAGQATEGEGDQEADRPEHRASRT